MPRKIFEYKQGKLSEQYRTIHNEEPCEWCWLAKIFKTATSTVL